LPWIKTVIIQGAGDVSVLRDVVTESEEHFESRSLLLVCSGFIDTSVTQEFYMAGE